MHPSFFLFSRHHRSSHTLARLRAQIGRVSRRSMACAIVALGVATARADVTDFRYRLEAPLADYLAHRSRFDAFAREYLGFVERELRRDSGLSPSDRRFLHAGRLHLAMLANDFARARASAEALRELESDPAPRALVGLATRALASAREACPGEAWTPYIRSVERLFSAQLALAAPAPSIETLGKLAANYAQLDAAKIGDEFLRAHSARVDARGEIDGLIADELARARHKIVDVVPVSRALKAAAEEQLRYTRGTGWLDIPGIEKRVLVPATKLAPKNTEATLIALRDGKIMLLWSEFFDLAQMASPDRPAHGIRLSPLSDDGYARISAMVSADDGRTWSQPWVAIDDRDALVNVLSPGLTRLADGRLMVSYSWRSSRNTNQGVGEAAKMVRFSADEGRTWSERQRLPEPNPGYHTGCHDRTYTLSGGRVLVQRHTLFPTATGSKQAGNYVSYSDDNGATWRNSPVLKDAVNHYFEEASIVERAEGGLLMVMRASRGQAFFTESVDKGSTWSEPYASGVVAPAAPTLLARIPGSADLLMIWNSQYVGGTAPHGLTRHPLLCAISRDGGKTWGLPKPLEIDPNYQWAYPGVLFRGDHVLLHYFRAPAMSGGRELMLARVPVAWFYSTAGAEHFR